MNVLNMNKAAVLADCGPLSAALNTQNLRNVNKKYIYLNKKALNLKQEKEFVQKSQKCFELFRIKIYRKLFHIVFNPNSVKYLQEAKSEV